MRNMLALIGLTVVVVGGAGWYLGWYKLDVSKAPDGKPQITTTINTTKATGDVQQGAKHGWALLAEHAKKAAEENKQALPPANTPAPVTTPQGNANRNDPNAAIFGPSYVVTPTEPKQPIPLVAPNRN